MTAFRRALVLGALTAGACLGAWQVRAAGQVRAAAQAPIPAQRPPAHVPAPTQAGAPGPAGSAAIAALFRDFCLAVQPSLIGMESRAAALGGSKQSDRIVPAGAGRSLHQETWLVRRETGIYQLTAMEGDAAAGPYRAVGCGLTAGAADGVELGQALAMGGLGAPARRLDPSGGNGASVVWPKAFGANAGRVVLSYGGALTGGASLHLILPKLPTPATSTPVLAPRP